MLKLLLLVAFAGVTVGEHPIKNVVLVMLENRAFDHMLGWLNRNNSEIRGLTGKEFNRYNASDPNSAKVYVNHNSSYIAPFDPGHSVTATTEEVFGCANKSCNGPDPAPMDGFVQHHRNEKNDPGSVMDGFLPEAVPIISTLAMEGACFDMFFAAVPGPTQVNRMYLHSGTSHGLSANNKERLIEGVPQETIFKKLDKNGKDWRVFFHDVSAVLEFTDMRDPERLLKYRDWDGFKKEVKEGTLPEYSFIAPRWFKDPITGAPTQDEHPRHDVTFGEALLKEIYEDLRAGPQWNETAFIVTYDEHGGFYDHVSPPMDHVPNPDGINATGKYGPPFDFDRLGVRIPFVVVSPWINSRTVIHEPTGTQKPNEYSSWDLSSVVSTLERMFDLPGPSLTKRSEWSAHFEDIFLQRTTPRTDLPMHLPPVPKGVEGFDEGKELATDLQKEFAESMAALVDSEELPEGINQEDLGMWARKKMCQFLESKVGKQEFHPCTPFQ